MNHLKFKFVSLFLCLFVGAQASHIVGGEITYTKAANGGYVVSLTMYRDCSNAWNSNFPSSVTMRAYDAATGAKLTNNFTLTSDSVIAVPNNINANCVTGIPNFCVEKRIYSATWNYTGSATNGIDFEYWLCCRNATISNLNYPNATGMRYKTTVFPGGVGTVNSTPVFSVDPPTIVAAGRPTSVDFAATDADGDSLYYEFTNALNQYGNSVNYATGYTGASPLPSTPAAAIDQNSGVISANITQQGQFVISVYITEYRNGIPLSRIQRDYQFNTATFSLMDIVLDTTYRPIQCDFSTGVVGVDVDYGQAPFSYSWNTGDTTPVILNAVSGTYVVTVEDAIGCIDSLTVILAEPSELNPGVLGSEPSCFGVNDGTVSANIDSLIGPYTYNLNGVQGSGYWNNLDTGMYNVLITDTNGYCLYDTTFQLNSTANWNPIIVDSIYNPSCWDQLNGGIQLAGFNPSLSLTWEDGSSNLVRTGLGAGQYSLFVLDTASGCYDSLHASITAPDSISLALLYSDELTCSSSNDGSFTIYVHGGTGAKSISINGTVTSPSSSNGDTLTFANLSSGSFQVDAVDALGCSKDLSLNIGIDSAWNNIATAAIQNPTCFGDTNGLISFSGDTTGLSFAWNDGTTTLNRTGLGGGSYLLIVTNSAGCLDTLGVQLTQNAPLTFGAITTVDASCGSGMDGEISATAIGGAAPFTYTLGATTNNNGNFSGLSSGAYLITVYDSTGQCSADTLVDVFGSSQGWNNITGALVDPVQCHGTSSGNILVQTSNGAPASSAFYWTDDTTAPLSRFGVGAGSYVLVIDNGEGCSDTMSFVVDDTAPISVQTTLKEEQCFGDGTGEISLQVSGGMAPYYFNWPSLNSRGKSKLNGVSAGTYYPTIVDDNGCLWADTIELGGPDEITVDLSHNDPYSCGSEDGVIDMMIEGGAYPYYITLNGAQIPNYYDNASAGMQEIVIRDASGCEWETSFELVPSHNKVVYFPNAFTPTGDGTNENFDVKGDPACFTDTEFIISDRWGNVYFRTDKPFEEFWDGSLPDLPEAQNLAQFQFRFSSNEYVQTGTLTLLK